MNRLEGLDVETPVEEPSPGFWASLDRSLSELAASLNLDIGGYIEGPQAAESLGRLRDRCSTRSLVSAADRTVHAFCGMGWVISDRARSQNWRPPGAQYSHSLPHRKAELCFMGRGSRWVRSRPDNPRPQFPSVSLLPSEIAPEDYTRRDVGPLDAYSSWKESGANPDEFPPDAPLAPGPRKTVCWMCLNASAPGGLLILSQRTEIGYSSPARVGQGFELPGCGLEPKPLPDRRDEAYAVLTNKQGVA